MILTKVVSLEWWKQKYDGNDLKSLRETDEKRKRGICSCVTGNGVPLHYQYFRHFW